MQSHIQTKWLNLPSLSLPVKALFTGYLLVVGLGLLVAGGQIMLTHGMADGKLGLSVEDIVYSYYGNREGSKLESKLNGSMKDKATPEENLILIKWAREGANENEWQNTIQPIVQNKCAMCHANIPGLPNVTKLEVMNEIAKVDEGASFSALTRVSHIHLFGIAFIFFFIGLIFSMSVGFKPWMKALLIFTPFAFLIIDIASWWLTKLEPNFAYFVIIGGFGYSVASTVMIFSSLYQMWILPMKNITYDVNTWSDK
ncbi:elongation factor-1 alpha [Thiomicrorhabdus indica]|uniref:elongation factor-1 alpha n=1 Tax=Thiomicrorhabdus indica TaxID=2267253 RepID=UPI002AA8D524|nr:elongation factor-1 alpha [Thiomicrorhabdus indica]